MRTAAFVPALAMAIALAAAPAAAQFTAAVVPPKKLAKVDTMTVRDSVRQAQQQLATRLTDMRTWVDSAASAIAARTGTAPADTAQAAAGANDSTTVAAGEVAQPSIVDTTRAGAAAPPQKTDKTERFRNGAPAPATATPLPLLALLGAAAVVLGLVLRRV